MRGIIIGRSALERADPESGVAAGAFRPGLGYELVQPIFLLFAESTDAVTGAVTDPDRLARYENARQALGLELVDGSGRVVSHGGLHIRDRTAEGGAAALEIDVHVTDHRFWTSRRAAPDAN